MLAFTDNNKSKHEQLYSQVQNDLRRSNEDEDDGEEEEEDEYEEDDDDDDDDFDANELLDMTDYQNKRKQQ